MTSKHEEREFAQKLIGCFGLDSFTTEEVEECFGDIAGDLAENEYVVRTADGWYVRP